MEVEVAVLNYHPMKEEGEVEEEYHPMKVEEVEPYPMCLLVS